MVRQSLIDKLIGKGIPPNLIHQLVIFLLSFLVRTARDLTETTAILTIGLVQGDTASPALFRFFIDDLAGDLREGQEKARKAAGNSMDDPGKLVADYVTLIADTQEEMQSLLDLCTSWTERNGLKWKLTECTIVIENQDSLTRPLILAGQALNTNTEAKYLGIIVSQSGSKK